MLLETFTPEIQQLMEQGNHWAQHKKPQQALLYFNRAVLLMPNFIEALIGCANMLFDLNRAAEAAIYSQRALQLSSTYGILALHGKILYQMGDYDKALDCFERMIIHAPDNYIALGQRALCLTQINRHEEALQAYQDALMLSEYKDDWIHFNYSLCLLATGNLLPGFIAFEYRWRGPLHVKNHSWIMPESATWEVFQGKSILVHSEQGLGDNIQFFRYIPLLVQLGARVYLEIQAALIPLFSAWHNTIHLIASGSPLPNCDYHCPLMSLARLFKTEINTIPHAIPYISPEPTLFESCQVKLKKSNRKQVGIAWRGSDLNTMNQQRSIALHTLLKTHQPLVDFICLQKDLYLDEKKQLDQYNIVYHGLELSTMMGTAALIACLDLIITVDTSLAHLAAAMGKEVWILLPLNADWRWFLHREDSPWYANVKLFRQTAQHDWTLPITRVKNALQTFSIDKREDSIHDLMTQAEFDHQEGFLPQAERLYRQVLIKNPINHNALHGMGLIAFQQNNLAHAMQFFHQAVEIAPDIALYRRNLGELLRRFGQLDAAITSFKIALNLEPDSAENYFLLGLAYNNNQQIDLSIQHYRLALSYDPNYGVAWNNLGASLEQMGDKHEAKIAYLNAIKLNPKHAEAQNNLGAIYSEEGQLEEARAHFEAAIAVNPDFIDAHYNLSLIKTYTSDDPHLAFIESMLEKIEQYSIPARIRYYFTLGKALDDIKQYKQAFKAYAEGNRLHYLLKPWNPTQLQAIVEYIPHVFTQFLFSQSQSTDETRYPIFVVGMPRSGTTLIEQILASHASIYGAGELSILDEVIQAACQASGMSFNRWATQLSDQACIELGKQYLEKTWKLAADKRYIIDKMPSNCFYIGMIYRMLPTAKIIHAIRDPMDSCFSCFTHLFKEGMTFTYDLTTLGQYYCLYARAMQHWHAILPPGAMFDVPYEEMVSNPELVSRHLIKYIGLEWDPNCLNFYNNTRIVKTASLTQVRKPIYKTSIQRWQHFATALQPLLQIVEPYRNIKGINA